MYAAPDVRRPLIRYCVNTRDVHEIARYSRACVLVIQIQNYDNLCEQRCDTNNMEGNKDEARKCLEIARRYLVKGDKEKAKKFISKSQKLYPLKEAESKCFSVFSFHVFPLSLWQNFGSLDIELKAF